MEDLSLALRAMFSQMKGDEILNALYRKDNYPIEHLDSECGESLIMKNLCARMSATILWINCR